MSKNNANNQKKKINPSKRNHFFIAGAIIVLLVGGATISLSSKSSKTPSSSGVGNGSSSGVGNGSSSGASPSPTIKNIPIPRSTTAAQTANEAPNVPSTPVEQTYFACLSKSFTMSTAECRSAEAVVAKETNIFGSNLAEKFKYQIERTETERVRDILVQDIGFNKVVVNGVDYFPKTGVRQLPTGGTITSYPEAKKSVIPSGIKALLYSDPHVGINFCVSNTSFDGKVTWKVNLTTPNIYLGTPCSPTSLN